MHPDSALQNVARVGVEILLNGLWQGLAIVFVTWLALRIFRKANASTRYAAWSLALVAIVVVPVVTSTLRAQSTPVNSVTPAVRAAGRTAIRRIAGDRENTVIQPLGASLREPAEPTAATAAPRLRISVPMLAATLIFAAWVLAALVVTGRLGIALVQLERLKNNALPLSIEMRDAMPRWSSALKGQRDVRVCVSDAIEVPVAVGLFDSMILLPSHLVYSLEANDLDRIALHELAHLLRNDDWSNGLQRVVSALLFFNPAVWFVARQLDIEREVACDDYVLQLSGSVRAYASCLTRMAEMTAWPHRPLAAPGVFITRKNISIRIERLLASGRTIGSSIALSTASAVTAALIAVFFLVRLMTPSIAFTVPAQSRVAVTRPHATRASRPATLHAIEKAITKHAVAAYPPPEAKPAISRKPLQPATPRTATPRLVALARASDSDSGSASDSDSQSASGEQSSDSCMGCNFSHADLRGHDFRGKALVGTDFSHANLQNARFDNATLTGIDFSNADLRNASFVDAKLNGCDMAHALLTGARFDGAQLTGCDIPVATLSRNQTRATLLTCIGCDFSGANFSDMDLRNLHITGENMSRANFSNADLSGAKFSGVDFSRAIFSGARLDGTKFVGCTFRGVNFRDADFSKAEMIGSDMSDSIMRR